MKATQRRNDLDAKSCDDSWNELWGLTASKSEALAKGAA